MTREHGSDSRAVPTRGPVPWWRIPLYPAAVPAAIVITTWSGDQIHPQAALRPLIVAIAVPLLLTLVACALLRDRVRGGLLGMATVLLILEGSYPGLALVLTATVLVIAIEGLVRRGTPLALGATIGRATSALGVVVVIAAGINIVGSGGFARGLDDIGRDLRSRGAVTAPRSGLPDILTVMLDGYPGDRAAELAPPSFDREAQAAALTGAGFRVQRNSHSNYLLTPETLASMFQMQLLVDIPALDPPWSSPADEARRLRLVINSGAAFDRLHEAGYELISIASGFSEVEIRHVDTFIDTGQPTEYEVGLLRSLGVGAFVKAVTPDLPSQLERDRIRSVLAAFEQVVTEPHTNPRFVFAHVPAPHAPWVFGPNGEPRQDQLSAFYGDAPGIRGITREETLQRVYDQTTYVGGLARSTLSRVLAARQTAPVVVLFSDHGPGTGFDFANPVRADLSERSSNFLATYTPGAPDLFGAFTTPVNIFPTILNRYLGLQLPRSPDTIYAWKTSNLDLVDVTQQALAR